MMMNNALALVALACIWQYGECTITAWSAPVIATATGTGTHAVLLNDGHTASVTGITIAATGTITAYAVVSSDPSTLTWAITVGGVLSLSSGTVTYSTGTTAIKLLVSATDTDGTVTATVMIDINVAPTITAHDNTVCILDQSGVGVDLIDLAASDVNTAQTMTWLIPTGNTGGPDFEITAAGLVQVAAGQTIVVGTTAVYTLVITASDGSNTPLTATTTVTASVQTTCGGSAAITLSLMTILAALVVTKLS